MSPDIIISGILKFKNFLFKTYPPKIFELAVSLKTNRKTADELTGLTKLTLFKKFITLYVIM
jgi:hypothetical protein